jgi:hypothetical protein
MSQFRLSNVAASVTAACFVAALFIGAALEPVLSVA